MTLSVALWIYFFMGLFTWVVRCCKNFSDFRSNPEEWKDEIVHNIFRNMVLAWFPFTFVHVFFIALYTAVHAGLQKLVKMYISKREFIGTEK